MDPSPSCSRPPVWKCWKRPAPSREKKCVNAKTPPFCTKHRLAKPVPFMRLSSTGESVEDLPVFQDFNPSNFQSTTAGKPKPQTAGVGLGLLDHFAKPLSSSNISRVLGQLATKNLTSVTSAASPINSEADLSILVQKFEKCSPQAEMEMQGSLHGPTAMTANSSSHQGGMNGFVKEGIYHSYTRNPSTEQFAPNSRPTCTSNLALNERPVLQTFRLLKMDPVHQNRFQHHHHPYMNRGWEKPIASMQYHSRQPGTGTGRVPVNWLMHTYNKGSSHALHNQFVDPRIWTQFIRTEALANRLQGRPPKFNKQPYMHVGHQCKKVKNQTDVTQGQKCAELSCTGNLKQGHTSCTPPKQSACKQTSLKTEPDLKVSVQTNPNEETVQHSDCELKVIEDESKNTVPSSTSIPGEVTNLFQGDEKTDEKIGISSEKVCVTSTDKLSDIGPESPRHCTSNTLHQSLHFDNAVTDQRESCTDQPESSKFDSKLRLHLPSPSAQLHSSLAYILSQPPNSDSDFTDSDWESSASTSPTADSCDFLKCWDDPYNPLYGWKCANRLIQPQDHEQVSQSVEFDDERDSGISSLRAQQDESQDDTDSSSWDEDSDEEKSLESSHLWSTLCSSSDPLNPLSGWMCKRPETENDGTNNSKNDKACELPVKVQLKIQNKPADSRNYSNSDEPSKSTKIPHLHKTKYNTSKMHPSVMFVLGVADSDSDLDFDSESDWDSEESDGDFDPVSESEWNSDPYNPLLQWKLNPVTPEKLKAVNAAYKCASMDKDKSAQKSLHTSNPENSAVSVTLATTARPLLKRTSKKGCLGVPDDGRGPDTRKPIRNKKVRFCERSPTVISFEVPMWSSEYTECRKGPWQEMARDRCRFMDRIRSTEAQIAHIFTPSHRAKVQERLHIET